MAPYCTHPTEAPDLHDVCAAYLAHRSLRLKPATIVRYRQCLSVFRRFLRQDQGPPPWTTDVLSKPRLDRFYRWLRQPGTGQHGRDRGPDSARQIVIVVQLMWAWADDSDRWPGAIPRPRTIDMYVPPRRWVRAPTWEEMDRCIGWTQGWPKAALSVLRYSGLRLGEVMQLEWRDVSFDTAEIELRAEVGKHPRHRMVPISPHLLALFRELWRERCNDGRVIYVPRHGACRPWRNVAQVARDAWAATGVPEVVWGGHPNHAFRSGFKSGMLRVGAPADAVDFLQGHTIHGARGRYIDPWVAFDLRAVVGLVPRIGEAGKQRDLYRG